VIWNPGLHQDSAPTAPGTDNGGGPKQQRHRLLSGSISGTEQFLVEIKECNSVRHGNPMQ
jgi:hypothetical protein